MVWAHCSNMKLGLCVYFCEAFVCVCVIYLVVAHMYMHRTRITNFWIVARDRRAIIVHFPCIIDFIGSICQLQQQLTIVDPSIQQLDNHRIEDIQNHHFKNINQPKIVSEDGPFPCMIDHEFDSNPPLVWIQRANPRPIRYSPPSIHRPLRLCFFPPTIHRLYDYYFNSLIYRNLMVFDVWIKSIRIRIGFWKLSSRYKSLPRSTVQRLVVVPTYLPRIACSPVRQAKIWYWRGVTPADTHSNYKRWCRVLYRTRVGERERVGERLQDAPRFELFIHALVHCRASKWKD